MAFVAQNRAAVWRWVTGERVISPSRKNAKPNLPPSPGATDMGCSAAFPVGLLIVLKCPRNSSSGCLRVQITYLSSKKSRSANCSSWNERKRKEDAGILLRTHFGSSCYEAEPCVSVSGSARFWCCLPFLALSFLQLSASNRQPLPHGQPVTARGSKGC